MHVASKGEVFLYIKKINIRKKGLRMPFHVYINTGVIFFYKKTFPTCI